MTFRLLTFTLLAGLQLVVSCSKSIRFTDPDYKGQKLVGGRLAMVELAPFEINIGNRDDVEDDLGRGADVVGTYKTFFNSAVQEAIRRHSTFDKVILYQLPENVQVERKELPIGDKSVIVKMLQTPQKLDVTERFVLFLNVLEVYRKPGQPGHFVMGPNGTQTYTGGTSDQLRHEVSYSLWDNEVLKWVGYGRVEVGANVAFAMTRTTWVNAIDAMVREIFKDGPFYKKLGYARQ